MLIIHLFFSVSVLTVFQSWFFCDDNVVFFSDIILFITFTFIISSGISLYSVWFGCVVFRFLLFWGSVLLEGSCFSVFSVSIIVLGSC